MENHNCKTEKERWKIISDIDKYGCNIALFEPTGYLPGFAYSIGLYQKFNRPEIICFGLKTSVLAVLINDACALIKQGEMLAAGKPYPDFLNGYDVQFLQVHEEYYQNYLGYGRWFYNGIDFPVLQLIWPDKQHLFPWEDGFNNALKFKQPLLDRNIDFKFYEERNVAVFTTSQVLDGEPILYIYHDQDGTWQFHSSDEPDLNDVKIVSLEQITKRDKSVNQLYHLEYGWRAWRDSITDDWEYEEYESEQSIE